MDDLLALDGGSAATTWQRKHNARKHREQALAKRRQLRAEAKADLKKRTAKWRKKWKAQAAINKAAGLPPPSRHGRPRDMSKPQWIDMTARRYGRWTVISIAPVSRNGKNHGRYWICRCDCGKSPERPVSGTTLRQGISTSCGCYRNEVVRANWKTGKLARAAKEKAAKRAKEKAKPVSYHLLRLRRRSTSRADKALISLARNMVVWAEVQLGIIKPKKNWHSTRYQFPRRDADQVH